jgi:hypothetical protein
MSSQVKQATKKVNIIARIQFKNDPRKVCYLVRSSNGTDQYTTCLFNGKACSCSCPARKPCYHMIQLEAREAERTAASQPAQAEDDFSDLIEPSPPEEIARILAQTNAREYRRMAEMAL